MEDELIKEIRTIKDKLASRNNYDLRALLNDIIEKQKLSNRKIVNLRKSKGLNTGSNGRRESLSGYGSGGGG